MNESVAVSLIIVNYNTTSFLRNCLNSINLITEREKTEISVIDNNSSERSIEELVHEYQDVNFILNDTNNGFAAGCNFGAEKAKGKYLLFLNPDIRLRNNSINILLNFFVDNSDTGILSGVMYDEFDRIIYFYNDFPSLTWELSLIFPPLIRTKIEKLNSVNQINENRSFEVDWFHGAFLMIKKDDFFSAGKFNEEYFIYYEDVELCYKIKNQLQNYFLYKTKQNRISRLLLSMMLLFVVILLLFAEGIVSNYFFYSSVVVLYLVSINYPVVIRKKLRKYRFIDLK